MKQLQLFNAVVEWLQGDRIEALSVVLLCGTL